MPNIAVSLADTVTTAGTATIYGEPVTVDGVSLTVSAVSAPDDDGAWFEVGLIPTTLGLTTLGRAPVGTRVNLEVDVLAKYVERIAAFAARPEVAR